MEKQPHILFTGFKGIHNTSCQLVDRIQRTSLFLTNSFSGLKKDIDSVCESYDAVYMFGADKNLFGQVRIEKCARLDDNTVYTDFHVTALYEAFLRKGIPCQISDCPTAYLCNSAYYQMLNKNKNSVFIHIPSIKGMNSKLMRDLADLFREV